MQDTMNTEHSASSDQNPAKRDHTSKKSSQACDNCRRKKVRCDGADRLDGSSRCSICISQNCECTFDHVPRQRGPARGFRAAKRQKLARAERESESPVPAGGSPSSLLPQQGRSAVSETLSVSSQTLAPSHLPSTALDVPSDLEWFQYAIDRWFVLYQPTFPVHIEDAQMNGFDAAIHFHLRAALLLATYSITYRSRTRQKSDALLAAQRLSQYSASFTKGHTAMVLDKLTYLQITLLLAIEADQRGYDVANSVHSVGYWLGQATGQAYDLRLHREDWTVVDSGQYILGRRLFLILIVLDRWHSVSTSSPPFVSDTNAKFETQLPFSGITNHLYCLSLVVGNVYKTILSYRNAITQNDHPALVRLKEEIETWRERVDVIWGQSNLLHVAYWHLCILSLTGTCKDLSDVLALREIAMRMASTLPNSATPYTPLNHHFFALTTCVLSHLLKFKETKSDARKGLYNLQDAIRRHKELVTEDDASWDSKLLEVLALLQTNRKSPRYESILGQYPFEGPTLLASIRRRGYLLSIDEAAF